MFFQSFQMLLLFEFGKRHSDLVGSDATPVTSTVRSIRIQSDRAAAVFEFFESDWVVSMP